MSIKFELSLPYLDRILYKEQPVFPGRAPATGMCRICQPPRPYPGHIPRRGVVAYPGTEYRGIIAGAV